MSHNVKPNHEQIFALKSYLPVNIFKLVIDPSVYSVHETGHWTLNTQTIKVSVPVYLSCPTTDHY